MLEQQLASQKQQRQVLTQELATKQTAHSKGQMLLLEQSSQLNDVPSSNISNLASKLTS